MKKRLLFAFMALCTAVSGFALSEGEYVYTPQGRFLITGANVASSNFADWEGWTVVSASTEKTLADNFNVNANGYAEGFNSVVSLDATAGEGMYFKFVPSDADATYVVSYKMKGATAVSIRKIDTDVSTNLVKVEGNSDNAFKGANDVVVCNTAEELSEDWQTFNYAIVGDGKSRGYFISFTGMATNIEIADLQIAPAEQFADLRQRDAMLEKLNVYKNCYDWKADVAGDLDDAIGNISAIGDESSQADLDDALETANEVLATFLKANMDDYLTGNAENYLGFNDSNSKKKNEKTNTKYGDWDCWGRGAWGAKAYPDLGHYQQGSSWCFNNPDNPMGVSLQKDLTSGSYVFAIEGNAAVREPKRQSWTVDEGMKPAYGVAYIVKVNGEQVDTIASVVKDLQPIQYTPFIVPAKITEDGTYEFGFKAYCKETHKNLTNGSVVYVKDASIWGKNENVYNQAQLGYEADVREQITTGRNNLTTAAEYLANADYLWGKAELKACVDTVETKIAAYELYDQDKIIATYQDYYVKSTSNEDGLMVYEVYQAGVKDIIAANKKFAAINDTLNSIQVAIDAAEATMALRIYGTATGKADLQTAIDVAKGVQAKMKAAQYSEENAATITAANADLAAAVETFKGTIPAANIATIVDIDFEADAIQNAETQKWEVTGAAGTMVFSRFSTDNDTEPGGFKKGFWSNGEAQWKGYLRVGNGTGTVNFDPTENGSMGTNILKINCDFFLQGLSKRFIGFFMKDEAGENIAAAFYANYYDNAIDAQSNLNIELGSLQYGSGGSYDNGSPEGAEPATANPLAKNSFEVILDYGEGTMYCTTTSKKGVVTTAKQEFTGVIPRSFILQSNYDDKFSSRYCWFDNLKIQRITAGEVITGIENVKTVAKAQDNVMYNLAGQKVNKSFKGIAIMNGKKIVVK